MQDGTAGAVNLARPYVKGPVLIIFVDTVFEADLTLINRTDADGIIWAKEVEDYQRFGVVVTDQDGYMTKIVEKPTTPISKLANIGLYYIRDVDALWQGISHVLAAPANKGEYYLTDAFQWMIEQGRRILTAEVGGWYDCGKLDTLLETNEILLKKGAARHREFPGVTIRRSGADRGRRHDRALHHRAQRHHRKGRGDSRLEAQPHDHREPGLHPDRRPAQPEHAGQPRSSAAVPGQRQPGRPQRDHRRQRPVASGPPTSSAAPFSISGVISIPPRRRGPALPRGMTSGSERSTPTRSGEHVAAIRSISGAVEDLDIEDTDDEIDRTALLDHLRVLLFRFEHEHPCERNPGALARAPCQCFRGSAGSRAGGRGTLPAAALARLRAFPPS